jgi:hypothetical protein
MRLRALRHPRAGEHRPIDGDLDFKFIQVAGELFKCEIAGNLPQLSVPS